MEINVHKSIISFNDISLDIQHELQLLFPFHKMDLDLVLRYLIFTLKRNGNYKKDRPRLLGKTGKRSSF